MMFEAGTVSSAPLTNGKASFIFCFFVITIGLGTSITTGTIDHPRYFRFNSDRLFLLNSF